jgi:co-chaperonin GroES (HSP10)
MFKPLHQFVTVVLDKKDKTPGGLVLPDGFGEVFVTGVVRAVGTGRMSETTIGLTLVPAIKVGQRVMLAYHQQQGPRGERRVMKYPVLQDEDVACILCDYTDIVGVVEESPVN